MGTFPELYKFQIILYSVVVFTVVHRRMVFVLAFMMSRFISKKWANNAHITILI